MVVNISENGYQLAQEKKAWFLIKCFIALIGLPLLVGLGSPLILVFPVSAVALGLFLYYQTPHLYIGFVFWIFFLANLIRRMIDFYSGYVTPGPWGLTAVLVSSISLLSVFQYLPIAHRNGAMPFVMAISGLGYASVVGFVQNPLNALVNSSLGWACPVAFAFHIFMQWRDYPKIKQVFIKTFIWGVFIMGVYALLQYVFAPPWEEFWFNSTGATSFGKAVPFGIRVFGTSGSPQAFAAIMLTGLIVLFCDMANPMTYFASGVGYISLILTMARAVWLSAAISLPLFFLSLKPSYQIRMLIVMIVIFVIVATALLSWEPVYEKFYARFESFLDVDGDTSLNARAHGYQILFGIAISQFLGQGMGFSFRSLDVDISLGVNDGSLFPLLFTFGWLGLVFYLGGFLMLLMKLLQLPDARSDIFIGACRIVVLCVLAQAGFNSVFNGTPAIIMWSFSAIGLAGHKYYLWQKQMMSSSREQPRAMTSEQGLISEIQVGG